ncbi:hypothetical protein, partial [Photorhabdus laumondii]|uniref:hypothetical protein n=1 Tax=Photorhabdus laumondii TaxID=2218628 RepID=UPI003314EEF4
FFFVHALTSTLTTTALYGSRLRWFEASSRQRTSVGRPPSLPELMLHTAAFPMLLVCMPAAHLQ